MSKEETIKTTLHNLKELRDFIDNYVAPPNENGWSLSNLPCHFWEGIGECIDNLEKLNQNKDD